MNRGSRRAVLWVNGALIGVVLLLASLAHLAGPTLLKPWLVDRLEGQGLGPVRLRVEQVGLGGVRLADLRLGTSGALSARGVELAISVAGLATGRLDRLVITGLRARATVGESGRVAIEDFPQPSGSSSGSAAPPVTSVEFTDAEITAATPAGVVALRVDGSIDQRLGGVAADLSIAGSVGPATFALPSLHVVGGDTAGWRIHVAAGTITAPSVGLTAKAIDADLYATADAVVLEGTIGALEDGLVPARFVPLAGTLHAERHGNAVGFTATVTDRSAAIRVAVTGRHALDTHRGGAELSVTPVTFARDKRQPRDLAPALATLPPIDGTIAAAGKLAWSRAGLVPRLSVTLDEIGLDAGPARIAGLHGTVELDGLSPVSTPPAQKLAGSVTVGTAPPMPVALSFQRRRDNALALESLALGVADGQLTVGDLVIPPAASASAGALAVPVHVADVELGTILEFAGIDGLSGNGRLDGALPLRVTRDPAAGNRVALDQGRLEARAPGIIRYVGAALPTDSTTAGSDAVGLLKQVLEDFHYERLALEVERGTDGASGVVLHLAGANPAVLDGRRFVLNIRLDANFDQLASVFLAGIEAAGGLTRELAVPPR